MRLALASGIARRVLLDKNQGDLPGDDVSHKRWRQHVYRAGAVRVALYTVTGFVYTQRSAT
jgi:hypothetical protein